jgi:hypothetical protein
MDNTLAGILGPDLLPEEMRVALQEAFDRKVAEAKEEAEAAVRQEMVARYERDKEALVEATDRMISDALAEMQNEKNAELAKIAEAHERLEALIVENKANYKKTIKEHVAKASAFISEQLSIKVAALEEAKKSCVAKERRIDENFTALKSQIIAEKDEQMAKIDAFVARNMKREITEMQRDHRALVEARTRFAAESKQKLQETQKRFIAEAAKKVDKVVTESLKAEITQLHEDLERNRQNMFGRRIFEAVAAEFMTSHLADATEAKKASKVLEAKEEELAALKAKLNEAEEAANKAGEKAKIVEAAAERNKIMSELLSNLRGDKRSLMESMLETTKTVNLRSAFSRLLPVVLNEGAPKRIKANSAPLRAVTGDKTRLVETQNAEPEIDTETAVIMRLAGIKV